jgi:hypothetical protein
MSYFFAIFSLPQELLLPRAPLWLRLLHLPQALLLQPLALL